MIPIVNEKSLVLLLRLKQSGTGEFWLDILEAAPDGFGLELRHIIGLTTDGAPMMPELGRPFITKVAPKPFYHQLCLAHCLHLAVKDTQKGKSDYSNSKDSDSHRGDEDFETEKIESDDVKSQHSNSDQEQGCQESDYSNSNNKSSDQENKVGNGNQV